MSYKHDMITELNKLKSKGELLQSEIIGCVRRVYHGALMESKKIGQSIESITYEILDGLEDALKHSDQNIENILKEAVACITEVIHQNAKEDITKTHRTLFNAVQQHQERIEAEKANLLESLEASKAYAQEKAYHKFAKHLDEAEKHINTLLDTLEHLE